MAFMALVMAGIVLLVLGVLILIGIVLIVVGLVLRAHDHKIASNILFVAGGVMIVSIAALVVLVLNQPKEIDTPNGTASVKKSWINTYEKALEEHDLKKLKKLIDKHPEMIYYYDNNHVMLLDYGLYNCDVEIMEIAVDAGAEFDEPLRYDHMNFYCSLDSFFDELDYPRWEKDESERTKEGETTREMIDAIGYAIDHGARTSWTPKNGYQYSKFETQVSNWIKSDGDVSDLDMELLDLVSSDGSAASSLAETASRLETFSIPGEQVMLYVAEQPGGEMSLEEFEEGSVSFTVYYSGLVVDKNDEQRRLAGADFDDVTAYCDAIIDGSIGVRSDDGCDLPSYAVYAYDENGNEYTITAASDGWVTNLDYIIDLLSSYY